MESILFLGFGLDAWITIATVLGMFTILLTTKWRTDMVFLGAIGVLYVTGVLDAKRPSRASAAHRSSLSACCSGRCRSDTYWCTAVDCEASAGYS